MKSNPFAAGVLVAMLLLVSGSVLACGSNEQGTPIADSSVDKAENDEGGETAVDFGKTVNGDASPADAAMARLRENESGVEASHEATVEAGDDGGTDAGFVGVIRLQNDLCLPDTLPQNGSGGTTCRVLLDGLNGTCGALGLSPASQGDTAAIQAKAQSQRGAPFPPGSVCEVNQLVASPMPGMGCSDQQQVGWCYVMGSCLAGNTCKQDICTTTAFDSAYSASGVDGGITSPYQAAFLVCP